MAVKKTLTLDEIRRLSAPVAKKHGVAYMGVFGSYARKEATGESDIDFLVGKGNMRTLIDYGRFVNDLEKKLRHPVDVITDKINNKEFLSDIRKELIIIYEKEK